MRAVVQRVERAEVRVGGQVVGVCGRGLLLLVGIAKDDEAANARRLAERIAGLRILGDASGKMNLALGDVGGEVLAVPNFTVFGDASSRRPSFSASAPYALGQERFEQFVASLRELLPSVQTGVFGADMRVELVNDGPVTLIVDA